jgi:hypothetical protein
MRERFHTHVLVRTTNPEQVLQEFYGGAFMAFDTKDGGATFPLPSTGYSEELITGILAELNDGVKRVTHREPKQHMIVLVMNERSEEELEKLCIQYFVEEKKAEEKRVEEKIQELDSPEGKKKQEEEAKLRRINEKIEAELAKKQSK